MKIIAKKLLSAFFTVQTLLMIMSVAVYAVPASPDAIEYTQPNGSVIQIRQYGDEFQSFAAVIHGENEYVVIPDDQGGYSYARQEYGTYGESSSFSSSAPLISAEQSPPSYAMNPSDYAQTLPEPDRSMTDPSDIRSRAVQDSDLSPYGKAPRVGAEEVLVVLVEFDPDPTQSGEEGELLFNRHNPDIYGTQTPEQHWEEKIFGKNATILSANDFYSENSNGKLWLEPYTIFSTPAGYDTPGVYRVTLPLKHPKVENVPYTDTFYGGLNNRYGAYSASAPPITVDGTTITVANMRVEEVAQSALQRQYGFSYDLAFANNKKLHRMYVISGSDMSADGVNSIGVWGHRTGSDNASSNNRFVFGEVEDGHPSTIGVFCHELGHDLFCPDFYDTRTGTFVAPDPEPEYYSAMASGSWGTGPGDLSGARPTHFDPWNKIGLGWYSATEINPYDPPLQLNAPSIPEDYNILKVSSNDPNQYFLIEQRSDFGFDKGIYRYNSNPTTRSNYYGVVVWRVDNNIIELSTLRNYNSQDRRGMTIINKSSEYVPYQPNDEFFLTFHTGEVVVGNGWETDVSKSAHPRAFKVIGESVKELGEFTAPTNVSETELTLNWTTAANSDAGFTYSIYQSTTEAAIDTVEKCELLTSVAVVDSGTYSHTISGLDAGTYYYSIVVDAAGGTFRKDAIGGNTTSGGKALYTPIEVICSGEPSAAVNSATVTGRQNLAIVGTDITITLNNATFNAFSENENVAGWFTNLPNGITATVKNAVSSGDKSIVITLQGIPSVSADNIKAIISIPVEALGSGASAPLSVEGSVVFNIAPTFGVTLTVNKDGVAYNSHSKTFTLRQNGIAISTGTGADATVTFNDLQRGTYMLYDGTSEQSNTGISVSVSTGNATASINYYTVTFEDMTVDAGNTEITAPVGTISAKYAGVALNSGDVVFGGKELVVTIEGLPENSEFGYVINWTGASGNQEGSGTTRVLKIRPLNATTTVGPSIVGRPGATVADVTISGIVNTLLTTQTANITLGNTKVKDALNSADVSSWFGGTLPNNMTAVATALANSTLIEITFGGTPTAISSTVMNITIPSVALITNESITVKENDKAKFEVVAEAPNYGIELTPADDKDFGSATLNYMAQTEHTVTVKNSGNQATGALTVALGGANPTSFTLSKTSITSLVLNGTDSFTVVPNIGLGVGNYSATVTVSGGNEISESFDVSFEVTALPVYEIELDPADDKDFGSAALNYTAQTPHSVTVTNSGNQATGALTVALGGANPTSFTLSKTSITSLALNGTDSFTVVPNTGLGVGNYSATVTVSGGNEISESFDVSFEVTALPVYEIELNPADDKDFGSATLNYTAQTPHSVTVKNTGNQTTGALTVALGGANPTSFTLSKTSITSLALNGTDSFTVVPNTGLGVGNYSATVTVSGGNEISESFNVSFEVTVTALPVYEIELDSADDKDFGSAALNYTAQTPHSVTVRNSGDQATGALTVALGGANPTSFTLSKVSIESLALNGTDSFTVVPNTGLGVGNYLATVTVSGGNETSESFDVSFEVTALPVPVITVDVQPAVLTTVKEGSVSGSISVSATVSNGYAANYQWFSNAVPSTTGGTAVPGETNKSFTIPAGLTSGTYYYFCEITASGGAVSVRSNIAKVVVEPKEPDIITAIVPSVSSDNPIKLDLNAIASAYIAISLGDGNEGNVLAANAEIKVANSEIASVEPANLVSGGNITVIGKSVGFTTILVEFSGGNVIDAAYNVEIEVEVTNSNVPPTVESVTVNPASVTLNRGASQIFTASVTGTNNPPAEVQWSVTGGSSGTFISSGGVLTIATDETAVTLIVTATSAQDGSKFASAYVTVIQPEPEPETYTISYNANGGSGTMLSSAVTQGINYPISPNAFVRFNYTFNGWNTRPDGSGNAYPANGIISNVTSNITLYAQWIINVIYNPINNEPSYFSSFNSSATQVAAEPASDSIVFVDGKETEIGNVTRLGNTSIITIPQDAFSGSVENATHDVAVIMPDNTQNGEVQLVIKNVDDLTSNNLYLSIQMDDIKYNIPPAAVDTAFIMRELGASDPSQVKLNININTNLESTEITKTEETIKANGLELVSKPMEFSLTAVYNGISSHITSFGKYVSRTAELPESTVSKTTTAVVIEQNGNVRHIPTRVYSESGKWYAEINSLTNSVYALVYKAEHFSDAEGKWYEGAVNEMVSRMIISGTGNNEYTGERPVTRAEFSSIIVRALGLRPTGNTAIFDDVSVNQWYSGYVAAAFEHGIISGRGERKFDPESYITWQEAMIMIRNAAKITELNSLPQGLDVYPDAVYVSDWARDSVKFYSGAGLFIRDGLLQPTENINRAETAAAILKLLQKSGIIDVRSKLD
ncbi:MAG: S-layer homology domain-containing protein [Clostridiales bacterium]|jgi:M6 family metalloprotease-like protein|nr:S-layer homology domain-containing protein [Clostridiales bacterium]